MVELSVHYLLVQIREGGSDIHNLDSRDGHHFIQANCTRFQKTALNSRARYNSIESRKHPLAPRPAQYTCRSEVQSELRNVREESSLRKSLNGQTARHATESNESKPRTEPILANLFCP